MRQVRWSCRGPAAGHGPEGLSPARYRDGVRLRVETAEKAGAEKGVERGEKERGAERSAYGDNLRKAGVALRGEPGVQGTGWRRGQGAGSERRTPVPAHGRAGSRRSPHPQPAQATGLACSRNRWIPHRSPFT